MCPRDVKRPLERSYISNRIRPQHFGPVRHNEPVKRLCVATTNCSHLEVAIEDAALTVRITGIFVETDSDVVQDPTQATHVLAYLYPFNNEVPRRVV
jgi:hypothetical protein